MDWKRYLECCTKRQQYEAVDEDHKEDSIGYKILFTLKIIWNFIRTIFDYVIFKFLLIYVPQQFKIFCFWIWPYILYITPERVKIHGRDIFEAKRQKRMKIHYAWIRSFIVGLGFLIAGVVLIALYDLHNPWLLVTSVLYFCAAGLTCYIAVVELGNPSPDFPYEEVEKEEELERKKKEQQKVERNPQEELSHQESQDEVSNNNNNNTVIVVEEPVTESPTHTDIESLRIDLPEKKYDPTIDTGVAMLMNRALFVVASLCGFFSSALFGTPFDMLLNLIACGLMFVETGLAEYFQMEVEEIGHRKIQHQRAEAMGITSAFTDEIMDWSFVGETSLGEWYSYHTCCLLFPAGRERLEITDMRIIIKRKNYQQCTCSRRDPSGERRYYMARLNDVPSLFVTPTPLCGCDTSLCETYWNWPCCPKTMIAFGDQGNRQQHVLINSGESGAIVHTFFMAQEEAGYIGIEPQDISLRKAKKDDLQVILDIDRTASDASKKKIRDLLEKECEFFYVCVLGEKEIMGYIYGSWWNPYDDYLDQPLNEQRTLQIYQAVVDRKYRHKQQVKKSVLQSYLNILKEEKKVNQVYVMSPEHQCTFYEGFKFVVVGPRTENDSLPMLLKFVVEEAKPADDY